MWTANILTLFPDLYPGPLGSSILGEARKNGKWKLNITDLKQFAEKYKRVDDTPFGGGPGMVIKPDVIDRALLSLKSNDFPIYYLSPRGVKLDNQISNSISKLNGITLLCGKYEGVDERVIKHYNMIEISIGDYILSGGDLAAMVLIDSVVRCLPNVLGNPLTLNEETFTNHLLEYPLYTQPREWKNYKVPDILLSGDHKKIKNWKIKQSEDITMKRRPDLWKKYLKLK
ncbi:MAG: tRNA (guanosine(37)-N1)-methyltransferase TrmD [Alphaproteobacteria bacterium]|nr:MAG: tRNA (guanosine(37)-N1)-methyltransferase TrmD [Alphaproteobacteria bacterium]